MKTFYKRHYDYCNYEQFLLLPHSFQMFLAADASVGVIGLFSDCTLTLNEIAFASHQYECCMNGDSYLQPCD